MAGDDGRRASELLRDAVEDGVRTLLELAEAAVSRLVNDFDRRARTLFTESERSTLTDALGRVLTLSDLLGRLRIRGRMGTLPATSGSPFHVFAETPLPGPLEAINFFRSLIPSLSIDPDRYGADMARRAFTLAVATDHVVLARVKDAVARRLETGSDLSTATADVRDVLDAAGVTPANPQYSEMVFRTNMMDSYNTGAARELQSDDAKEFFPVWEYLGVDDDRAGDDHRPHFGKYYRNSTSFHEVRGDRVFNCRCTFRPVDKYEWADLQEQGVRVEG